MSFKTFDSLQPMTLSSTVKKLVANALMEMWSKSSRTYLSLFWKHLALRLTAVNFSTEMCRPCQLVSVIFVIPISI